MVDSSTALLKKKSFFYKIYYTQSASGNQIFQCLSSSLRCIEELTPTISSCTYSFRTRWQISSKRRVCDDSFQRKVIKFHSPKFFPIISHTFSILTILTLCLSLNGHKLNCQIAASSQAKKKKKSAKKPLSHLKSHITCCWRTSVWYNNMYIYTKNSLIDQYIYVFEYFIYA